MKLLEIIELRSVSVNKNDLEKQLKNLIRDLNEAEEIKRIKIYARLKVDSDFSIHIFNELNHVDDCGSPLGLLITSALKEFGLVNHKILIELSSTNDLQNTSSYES